MTKRNPYTAQRWTTEEALGILQDWKKSGQSLVEFGQTHHLPWLRLNRWRLRLCDRLELGEVQPEPSAVRLAEVTLTTPANSVQTASLEIILPNEIRIRVPSGTDPRHVRGLIEELQAC